MDITNLNIQFDKENPLYIQLYNFIKSEIQKGNLKANDKLPSKRKLSKALDISQNTIESSYGQLITEGYIVSLPKKGYYVSNIQELVNINRNNNINDEKNIKRM